MALGLYVSIPFCKAKCSFCNFASGVFAPERMHAYVDRLCAEIRQARAWSAANEAELPGGVDSIYFGGGTPSLLEPELFREVFAAVRAEFEVDPEAEITVECAPGQMADGTLEALLQLGMNRVSLGVQSFVDRESAAVGRLHTAAECRAEIVRLGGAGIARLGLDLIVGLPHQTEASWRTSVKEAIATGVEHVSVYMLEVDEDSRLGREALAGGGRYGAGELPPEDCVAEWFDAGCEGLARAGLKQYEISNFAREGGESRHNKKYWQRDPYLGIGLDAHSMLNIRGDAGAREVAVRWANPDEMQAYTCEGVLPLPGREDAFGARTIDRISHVEAFEESLFLGLRLVAGVDLIALQNQFGTALVKGIEEALNEVEDAGLVLRSGDLVQLTRAGQMLSNEVFSRLLVGVPA